MSWLKTDGKYSLTETARVFLVPSSPKYAGGYILLFTGIELWDGVLNTLRGKPRVDFDVPWHHDAWLESYSHYRIPNSLEMWTEAGFIPGECKDVHILDVGCGCAIKSFSLAQTDQSINITCVDGAEVLEVSRELSDRMGVSGQVTYKPGNIHELDFGNDTYDAALLGQISYLITLEQNLNLFRRVHQALKPGGVLVIDSAMQTEPPDELASERSLFLWAMYGGSAHTFEAYKAILKKQGLVKLSSTTNGG